MVMENSDYLLGVKVYSQCKKKNISIEDITRHIYGNQHSKNVLRVYQCMVVLMKEGLVIPTFKRRMLRFRVNGNNDIDI